MFEWMQERKKPLVIGAIIVAIILIVGLSAGLGSAGMSNPLKKMYSRKDGMTKQYSRTDGMGAKQYSRTDGMGSVMNQALGRIRANTEKGSLKY